LAVAKNIFIFAPHTPYVLTKLNTRNKMPFEYSPLENGCIRLLTVSRGQPDSSISCSLKHSSLGDLQRTDDGIFRWSTGEETEEEDLTPEALEGPWVPEYEALSYTWGSDSDAQPCLISIDGSEFRVTKNLYSALQVLRSTDGDRVLWVDAVCINQNDNEEKSWQVEIMRTIYLRAQGVIIWLGEEGDDSKYAMDLLEKMGGSESQLLSPNNPRRPNTRGLIFDHVTGIAPKGMSPSIIENPYWMFLDSLGLMDRAAVDARGIAALDKLLHRPWWSRVWIVQEATFAKNVWIQCGDQKVRWDTFANVVRRPLGVASEDHMHAALFRVI
jgi:hypothetical protein